MATLTLNIDNDTLFNNLKNVLKLMKGVTIIPTYDNEKPNNATDTAKPTKDISGIGGAWASEDFPTPEDIYRMRKSTHIISEL